LLLATVPVFGFSCQRDNQDDDVNSVPTLEFEADLPKEWMIQAYNTVKRKGLFALDVSRIYAYTAITMCESNPQYFCRRGILSTSNGRSTGG
jgi:hypothetical protein